MFYSSVSALFVVLGIVVCVVAARTLLQPGWFLGWLRGMMGFLLLVTALGLLLGALDFFSYKAIIAEKHVATLELKQLSEQEFGAVLIDEEGRQHHFVLYGDQWQIDARLIKWPSLFAAMGVRPGYRLERISGRYYSWQQELDRPRSVHPVDQPQYGVDVWQWARRLNFKDIGIDTSYGSATYLPMVHGARYEVLLTHSGLIARPNNQIAESAVSRWMQ